MNVQLFYSYGQILCLLQFSRLDPKFGTLFSFYLTHNIVCKLFTPYTVITINRQNVVNPILLHQNLKPF